MSIAPDFDVLGFGTLAVDGFLYVEKYPAADGKVEVLRERRGFGGLVATALAAAARLGARCGYAAVLGHDAISDDCLRGLIAAGVRDDFILREPGAGPVRSIIVVEEKRGTRTIFFNRGGHRAYPSGQITAELLQRARVLLIDQTGIDTMIDLAKLASSLGLPVVADMESPDRPRTNEFTRAITHLIAPLHFARAVTGQSDPEKIVQTLHYDCPRPCTAVTCGTDGCLFMAGKEARNVCHQPAFQVRTMETTGCGDVYHGAYASALASGKPVHECIRFASAAAAVYASRPSGWEFLPKPEEIQVAGTDLLGL
jgi:sulfofructose kinase